MWGKGTRPAWFVGKIIRILLATVSASTPTFLSVVLPQRSKTNLKPSASLTFVAIITMAQVRSPFATPTHQDGGRDIPDDVTHTVTFRHPNSSDRLRHCCWQPLGWFSARTEDWGKSHDPARRGLEGQRLLLLLVRRPRRSVHSAPLLRPTTSNPAR